MKFSKGIVYGSLLFLLGFPCKNFADDKDSTRVRVGILPVIFYAPETRLGMGAIVYSYFKTSKKDASTRKSTIQTYINFTINKQFLLQTDYSIFSPQNKFYFKGNINYEHFPEFYYGIGNNTREDIKCLIDFNSFQLSSEFYTSLRKNSYAGLLLQHQNLYMLNKTLINYYDNRVVYGNMGYNTSGIGLGMLLDKRNNQLNPEKGHYVQVNFLKYFNHNSMQSGFNSLVVDMRFYKTVFKNLVWNINGYTSFNSGEVPFRMMPFIGGPRFLRGYYRGRFRDNNLIMVQHEFRYPLFWRFGIALFSGVGQVARNLNDFNFKQFHYNYGAGLRFKIDRKENTNVRIDFGCTKDSYGVYVVFAEAF